MLSLHTHTPSLSSFAEQIRSTFIPPLPTNTGADLRFLEGGGGGGAQHCQGFYVQFRTSLIKFNSVVLRIV